MNKKPDHWQPVLLWAWLAVWLLSGCRSSSPFNPETVPPQINTPSSLPTSVSPSLSPTPGTAPTSEISPSEEPPAAAPTPAPLPETTSPEVEDGTFTTRGILPGQPLTMYDQPGKNHPVSGEIPAGSVGIQSRGKPETLDSTTWVPIRYHDLTGWVPEKYLAQQFGQVSPELSRKSLEVLAALRNKDFAALPAYVHPETCLRFSPYPHLTPENLVFCPEQLPALAENGRTFQWGRFDGTGNPIEMTPSEYAQEFIYDVDYTNAPVVGFNQAVSWGNSPNNISQIYPRAVFIEYHFPEIDPQYGGMDWRSLRLVFKEMDQVWYLVAVVHGEWTI